MHARAGNAVDLPPGLPRFFLATSCFLAHGGAGVISHVACLGSFEPLTIWNLEALFMKKIVTQPLSADVAPRTVAGIAMRALRMAAVMR